MLVRIFSEFITNNTVGKKRLIPPKVNTLLRKYPNCLKVKTFLLLVLRFLRCPSKSKDQEFSEFNNCTQSRPQTVTEPGVWRWGVHENPDSPEAFHKRRMHEFANLD